MWAITLDKIWDHIRCVDSRFLIQQQAPLRETKTGHPSQISCSGTPNRNFSGKNHDGSLIYRRDTAETAVMRYTHLSFNPPRDKALLIGVNLMSNVVSVCCLTIKARSPLAPLKKGGTGSLFKSPFLRGI